MRPTRICCQLAAVGGSVSDELLDKLGTLSTQSLIDGLWVMGWPDATIEGARPLGKGQKACGRAVTLNFVPQRPDIAADKPAGMESPEYEAFEQCGPRSVLVMSSVGPWESVGGDIKFLRLKQLVKPRRLQDIDLEHLFMESRWASSASLDCVAFQLVYP